MEQVGRCEHGPHALECLDDLGSVAQPLPHLVGLDRHAGAVGQRGVDAGLDVASTGVVQPEAPLGVSHDGLALADA